MITFNLIVVFELSEEEEYEYFELVHHFLVLEQLLY